MSAIRRARPIAAMAAALAWLGVASGAPAWGGEPMPRPVLIGVVNASWGETPQLVGLREGLTELGYEENADFVIGVRFTRGTRGTLLSAARKLALDGIQILYVDADIDLLAVRRNVGDIPIVFSPVVRDPVASGLIESYARPGSNMTGITGNFQGLGPKRLEMLVQLVPGLKRVWFIHWSGDSESWAQLPHYRRAGQSLGVVLEHRSVGDREQLGRVLDTLRPEPGDAIISPTMVWLNIPGELLQLSRTRRVPTMFDTRWYADHGGLASYGPSAYATGRESARLVAKIIEGTDPAEIPVEVMSDIEFVVNLKTAAALGIEVPPEVLFQADRIIR